MNPHLASSLRSLSLHGVTVTYTVRATPVLNLTTGIASSSSTSYEIKSIPKHIVANQYNYPSLVGKDSMLFYVVNESLPFTPGVNDKITLGTDVFTVQSIVKHYARGDLVLFKLLTVKG